ncbi:MAG: hypothetical protein ACREHG_05385 [Candidatus Saccharimonadales bacterium]
MALGVGSHADVSIPNVLIEQIAPDGSYALVSLPSDGSIDGDGNPVLVQLWLPIDSRVIATEIAPPDWPPQENDLWIVPNVTAPAFVVSDGGGGLFFLTADTIRAAYASQGKPSLPPTAEQALAAYGTALLLLHRGSTV